MSDKSLLMKHEIRNVSGYRALIVSKYYFITVLSLITIYLCILRLAASSLYILLSPVLLPSVLNYVIRDHAKKSHHKLWNEILQERPFCLSILKSKYGYSRLNYVSNSITYLVTILLTGLWQLNYSLTENLSPYIDKLPFFVLISGLTLRILAVIIYQIKLPNDLRHNKV